MCVKTAGPNSGDEFAVTVFISDRITSGGIMEHLNGLGHIGLPCKDMEETAAYYEALGFKVAYSTVNNGQKVSFLQQGNLMIEAYEEEIVGKSGAINHICIDTDDVEACFDQAKKMDLVFDDGEIHFLPFWEKGVRYFIVIGPNAERIEFCQVL